MWGAFLEEYIMVEELKSMVGMDETILYEGYPNDLRPKENHGYKTKYRG